MAEIYQIAMYRYILAGGQGSGRDEEEDKTTGVLLFPAERTTTMLGSSELCLQRLRYACVLLFPHDFEKRERELTYVFGRKRRRGPSCA